MSDDVRGSEPVMNAKEAIMEVRGDVKVLLAFMAELHAADLPQRMARVEGELAVERGWRKGIATIGGGLGTLLVILQIMEAIK